MVLGIDVGGTNTDAVLVDSGVILRAEKTPTLANDLLSSITSAVDNLIRNGSRGKAASEISEVHLSTTLTTNLLVQNKQEKTAVITAAGPGIYPGKYKIGDLFEVVSGGIDHQGTEIEPIDEGEIKAFEDCARKEGIGVLAVVTKFSTRNPSHETGVQEMIGGSFDFVSLGHRHSGTPNFPRRINTAYFNSAVWRVYKDFVDAVLKTFTSMGITAPLRVLKADGGTMPVEYSKQFPVETILSGPSASVMGALALNRIEEDVVVLDLGGTTTDCAVFAHGTPLLDKEGARIADRQTLIRAIKTTSIGIGGDSAIMFSEKNSDGHEGLVVGPERYGPAVCFGGHVPTITDALNVIGASRIGDVEASVSTLTERAARLGKDVREVAKISVSTACKKLADHIKAMVDELRTQPVYTIHEMLHPHPVIPKKAVLLGGPADALAGPLSSVLDMEVIVSPHSEIANAVGSAVTKSTITIELFADTEKGFLTVPELNVNRSVSHSYSLEQAKTDAKMLLAEHIEKFGFPPSEGALEILEAQSFPMMDWVSRLGDNIRVKCGLKPGISSTVSDDVPLDAP